MKQILLNLPQDICDDLDIYCSVLKISRSEGIRRFIANGLSYIQLVGSTDPKAEANTSESE